MSDHHRRSMGAGFENWRRSSDGVFEKLRQVARNNWRKARSGSGCCGHHGQPGC